MASESDLHNTTAEGKISNTSNPNKNDVTTDVFTGATVFVYIISSIEIPLLCLAIFAVYTLIKSKQATPAFVINLLISDLIQAVSTLLLTILSDLPLLIFIAIMIWVACASLYFMTCIAIERYVMIAHPIWHRSHRSVKCLMCTSLTCWLLPGFSFVFEAAGIEMYFMPLISLILYTVIIACFVGACRSLSQSPSLTPIKKQLVLAPLFFVLMSYMFLTIPINIMVFYVFVSNGNDYVRSLTNFTIIVYLLNPLVDCLLYVFMRSDTENIIRTPHCCSRLKRNQDETQHTMSTEVQSNHV